MSLFNTPLLREHINATGLTLNQVANRLDLSNTTVENLVSGRDDPGELRIATLRKFADLLGLPLTSLFAPPENAHQAADTAEASLRGDTHQLIACLHTATARTSTTTVASALGWTLQHLKAVTTAANNLLTPSGLRITATNGEVYLATIDDHTDATRRLAAEQANETGFRHDQYKAVYQLLTTGTVAVSNTAERRRAQILNPLAVLGVINLPMRPSEGITTLTDAAHFAFL